MDNKSVTIQLSFFRGLLVLAFILPIMFAGFGFIFFAGLFLAFHICLQVVDFALRSWGSLRRCYFPTSADKRAASLRKRKF